MKLRLNAFVIKSWSATDVPDANGRYIGISGRAGGFVSWALNLVFFAVVSHHLHAQVFKVKNKPQTQAQPTIVSLTTQVPSLAPLAESPSMQAKGGLRITVSTETYQSRIAIRDQKQQVAPPTFLGMTLQPAPNAIYVRHTYSAVGSIEPKNLVFHIHINNELPRVFHSAGMVVQFNVDGKIVDVDSSGYGELVNLIIPPRGERDLQIVGPPIDSISTSATTIGFFLYDVVTDMDSAGNIKEKQNFEWYYSYRTQTTAQQATVPGPTAGWEAQ